VRLATRFLQPSYAGVRSCLIRSPEAHILFHDIDERRLWRAAFLR
jgi:hypothetical protein